MVRESPSVACPTADNHLAGIGALNHGKAPPQRRPPGPGFRSRLSKLSTSRRATRSRFWKPAPKTSARVVNLPLQVAQVGQARFQAAGQVDYFRPAVAHGPQRAAISPGRPRRGTVCRSMAPSGTTSSAAAEGVGARRSAT